jgi:muramoyltetrapeptide carboxypeptidase LdcA involved in peptidoglycan recycling
MSAFADTEVAAVWCSMGGDHSNQLLEHLDFGIIRRHPKVFVGYADNTVLHAAIGALAGVVTFHGTGVLTGLGEYPEVLPMTRGEILRALTRAEPLGALPAASAWTDESMRWSEREDLSRPRTLRDGEGWEAWREGEAVGALEGGCIASLMHLAGTKWWPDFGGAVLLVETSEHWYPPSKADAHLTDLDHLGVFDVISALLVARPARYTSEEKVLLREVVLERTVGRPFPVVGNVDAGHADPVLTLPLGCRTRVVVSGGKAEIEVLESATV